MMMKNIGFVNFLISARFSRLMYILCFLGLCSLKGQEVKAQVTQADYRRIDTLGNRNLQVYHAVNQPVWIGKTHYFWYLDHGRDKDVFWMVNAENGEREEAFQAEKLAAALSRVAGRKIEARKLPFRSLDYDTDRKGFEFEWNNRKWHYSVKHNKLTRRDTIVESRMPWERPDPKAIKCVLSPDERWEAYNKDNNIYIKDRTGEKEYALSWDGTKDFYYSGELVWSPDSKKLAVVKVRDIPERRIPLIESSPVNQKQPVLQWRDYAKPGDVLPVYLPVLFDVEKKLQIPLDTRCYENQFYLQLTGWRADSRAFTFEFNQRGHQRYIVAEVNAGSGEIRPLIDEQSPTFIHYNRNFRYDLKDGKEILWISERDGWRHLYLIDGEKGEVKRQLTKGEWVVREVEKVDEENGKIWFTASGIEKGEDSYQVHYCRIGLDGTGFVDLTPEPANHHAVFSEDRQYLVDRYSRPDFPGGTVIRKGSDGSIIAALPEVDIEDLLQTGWQMPEVFQAKGRDGKTDIWGTILRPSHFDASHSYPVVEMIYAGPHDSHVDKDFRAYHHLTSRLCELGFIVVMIDGMGTANRSKAFHDVCWKNLKDAGFPDRIAWIKAAAEKYPYMDTSRVGIYGWSAGGQNAMAALLFQNDFYKAAVALCGCHDNRMDKIWWNEQWMGYPLDESYSASSNVDNAWRLKGKLLLINGELDDNVDPASTLQVVNALINAGKNFEQLYLPNHTHSLGGKFVMHRIHDFFVKQLLNQDPPEWE